MQQPKPKKGEYWKMKKRERKDKEKAFRVGVMEADRDKGCCNPFVAKAPPEHPTRSYYEAAHLMGRGRKFSNKPSNGIKLCWSCHDWIDKRNDVGELSADERKIKVLTWWRDNRPDHFNKRGWAKPLDALENSVARRKVGK